MRKLFSAKIPKILLGFVILASLFSFTITHTYAVSATTNSVIFKDYGSPTTIFHGTPSNEASKSVTPNSIPGVINCIAAAPTLLNTGGYDYQVTFGISNHCSNTIIDIDWYIDGTITCGNKVGQGISVSSDNAGSLSKGAFSTLYSNNHRSSNCLVNGEEVPNKEVFQFSANGDISGTSNVGETPSTYETLYFPG